MEEKIVYLEMGTPSIFFPSGKKENGGTCEYATDICLKGCPSILLITELEKNTLKYFKENSAENICVLILNNLVELNDYILGWNAWGDILDALAEKTAKVVDLLNKEGIPQFGYTRNPNFWKLIKCKNDLRIGLSVDSLDKAYNMSFNGLVCCPNYDKGIAQITYKGKIRATCSGYFCTWDDNKMRACKCIDCFTAKQGCFWNDTSILRTLNN